VSSVQLHMFVGTYITLLYQFIELKMESLTYESKE